MEEKELIEIFENLIKDCTRVAEGTQYVQNLQILSKANKALKKVKKNGVLHSVSKSALDKTKKKKFKHNHKVCGCGRPYSQKDLEDGMCNKCCAPTM